MDVTQTTWTRLQQIQPKSVDDVRLAPLLVTFSETVRQQADELKAFLLHHLYRHYKVARMTAKARHIVKRLFEAFLDDPALLPPEYRCAGQAKQARAIADYIAGMTDRFAILEYRRVFKMDETF
jgi:dGTPase